MKCYRCGKLDTICDCYVANLVFRPPTEKDMASDKYKKAQEICEKEKSITLDFEK